MAHVANASGISLLPISRPVREQSSTQNLRATTTISFSSSTSPHDWCTRRKKTFLLVTSARNRDDSTAEPKDDVWSRRSLSSLEKELLGVGAPDAQDGRPDARPEGSENDRGGGKSRPPPIRMKANGEEWSLFDEMESRLPTSLLQITDAPALQKLVKVGKWLEQKTIPESKEARESPAYGAFTVLSIFPLWLFLVLLATGVIHLPPQLHALEDSFNFTPQYTPRMESPQLPQT